MSEADDTLAVADAWLAAAIAGLMPAARKALLRQIGQTMRQRSQARIARQQGPDGTPWAPRRKTADGRVRKKAKMMLGLRNARRMALSATAETVSIGYEGRLAHIASVHQFGLVDAVDPEESGAPKVKYPARPLLGLSVEDVAYVRRAVLEAMKET